MKPDELVLRCYAENSQGYWAAYCLDLTLYAVGDTFEEAREKLDQAIVEYVQEAIEGADRAYAEQLLYRRAPLWSWLKYYHYKIQKWLGTMTGHRLFTELMPLVPSGRALH